MIFPDGTDYRPLVGYEWGELENVRRTPPEAGASQRRDLWGITKFWAALSFDQSLTYASELMAFWRDNRASEFEFFNFDASQYNDEVIGTGDGVTLTFTIPGKESSQHVVEVADGVGGWTTKTLTTHYTISSGTGAAGQDRIVFAGGNAPASGREVRVSFLGRHHYTCEFEAAPSVRVVSSTGRKQLSLRLREAW